MYISVSRLFIPGISSIRPMLGAVLFELLLTDLKNRVYGCLLGNANASTVLSKEYTLCPTVNAGACFNTDSII
jgi:hypothetical protein